jgi:pimeloyl-ACP methyl ester carboxylesterase
MFRKTSSRVCTYDRSGYGWSQAGPQPGDGKQVVSELHALLQGALEAGAYLLVGHSLGGVHVRMFSAQHPEEVTQEGPWAGWGISNSEECRPDRLLMPIS